MRCNWQRWLWGLIPLVMVSWIAVQVERDRIQQDLTERAKGALTERGLPWASVETNGRDVVLAGRAVQDSEPPRAEETVRNVWGVRVVDNRAILPPKVEPFVWSARRRGNRIRLMGYVSDRATRQAVIGLTKAAMPGLEVVDRMNTARGIPSPDTWLAGLSFALKQLSLLRQGDARFDDLALSISGEAEDAAAYKVVNGALKSGLPKGIKLASAQIAAPLVSPYTWSARFAGGQLVMAGHVAGGEKARADLLAAAKAAAPAVNIVDRMEPAEGAPKGWASAVIALMQELVRLESGTLELKDAAFTVGGVAPDETQAQSIRTALRASVPSAFTLVDQVRVREVKAPEPPAVPPPPQPLPQTEPAPRASAEPPQPAAPRPPVPDQTAPVPPTPTDTPKVTEVPQPAVPRPTVEAESKQTAPPAPIETPKQAAPAPQPPSDPEPKKQAAPCNTTSRGARTEAGRARPQTGTPARVGTQGRSRTASAARRSGTFAGSECLPGHSEQDHERRTYQLHQRQRGARQCELRDARQARRRRQGLPGHANCHRGAYGCRWQHRIQSAPFRAACAGRGGLSRQGRGGPEATRGGGIWPEPAGGAQRHRGEHGQESAH